MTANSCPCGRLGMRQTDNSNLICNCFCSHDEINRYWRKFGGALLDRVEIRVAVFPPKIDEMSRRNQANNEEKSKIIARRVKAAVEIQQHRFKENKSSQSGAFQGIRRNAFLPAGKTSVLCPMSEKAENAFHLAIEKLGLSGRAYHGILRVARTIADLEGNDIIGTEHILEAVQYRRLGEDPWEIMSIQTY